MSTRNGHDHEGSRLPAELQEKLQAWPRKSKPARGDNWAIVVDKEGYLDQLVAQNCGVHLERLSESEWWLQISLSNGAKIRVVVGSSDDTDCQAVADLNES